MEDARVCLAEEAGADEQVVAIFFAGVGGGCGLSGGPEVGQAVAAIVVESSTRGNGRVDEEGW